MHLVDDMRIAQVAPLFEPVPPALYGGTERVVSYLIEQLVQRGHHVTLFASGDSQTSARLVSIVPRSLRQVRSRDPLAPHVIQLAEVFERAREFDLIHCHVDYLAFPFGRLVSTPTVHTMHGRLDLAMLRPVFQRFADTPLVSISDAQRQPLHDLPLHWAGTVYHGLPLDRYPFSPRGGGRYLAFLGRLSPEKRPDLAVAVALRTGLPLKIAAKVDPADQQYFERELVPLLDHPLIEFIGEIGDRAKSAFLGEALALLFPIDWPEPFGLAMIEAMACGTPVIARPCGAAPEIVVPGLSGFLVDTLDEMVEAVKRVDTIDRADCRRHAAAHFSAERMVDGYEAIYRRLTAVPRAA
jgi:glycosyltransferase involved in cell wall biosynthesis